MIKKIKKNRKSLKILSCITAVMVAFTMTAASADVIAADKNKKEETVYVITNADGSNKETIVSDHLYNNDKSEKIEDVSPLTDIENVKGNEKYKKGDGDSLVWNAAGNDIYYQGNTDQTAPITLEVKYYLDGKEVTGDQLDGKSGKLKIVINYENNQTVTVNGNSVKVPFIVMTGFMVEDDSFSNATISNGKIIDDGEKQVIVGMAAPGIAESLGVEASEIGFSDTVTIEGTAKNFSLDSMMTVATSDVFKDINTGKLSGMDMDAQINALDSGSKQLVTGSTTLYNGLKLLNDKSQVLSAGVNALDSGAQTLKGGTQQAYAGSQQLAAGAANLSNSLDASLNTLLAGANSLQSGSTQVYNGLVSLQTGVNSLKTGSAQVVTGVQTAKTNLDTGISYAQSALADLEAAKTAGTINDPEYTALKNKITAAVTYATGVSDSMATGGGLNNGVTAVNTGVNNISGALDGDGTAANPGLVNGALAVKNGATALVNGLTAATATSGSLTSGAKDLSAAANQMVQGQQQISGGASELATGMTQLNTSSVQLISGVNTLYTGSKALQIGMAQLYNQGIKKIVDLYNSDLKGISGNIDAVIKAGQQYNTFTQLPDNMDGNVKFIYKTEVTKEQ